MGSKATTPKTRSSVLLDSAATPTLSSLAAAAVDVGCCIFTAGTVLTDDGAEDEDASGQAVVGGGEETPDDGGSGGGDQRGAIDNGSTEDGSGTHRMHDAMRRATPNRASNMSAGVGEPMPTGNLHEKATSLPKAMSCEAHTVLRRPRRKGTSPGIRLGSCAACACAAVLVQLIVRCSFTFIAYQA